jgi:hypothetical protein
MQEPESKSSRRAYAHCAERAWERYGRHLSRADWREFKNAVSGGRARLCYTDAKGEVWDLYYHPWATRVWFVTAVGTDIIITFLTAPTERTIPVPKRGNQRYRKFGRRREIVRERLTGQGRRERLEQQIVDDEHRDDGHHAI